MVLDNIKMYRNISLGNTGKGGSWAVFQFLLVFILLMGCARVSIDTKKPIQVDVKMRVDIYQYVAKDVENIEDMISSEPKAKVPGPMSYLFGIPEAYAQEEGYPKQVLDAIERRKMRKDTLIQWQQRGIFGENNKGKIEVRDPGFSDRDALAVMSEENSDREILYRYVAEKNGASVASTAKVFAQRIQEDAPAGTPIQSDDGQWNKK